MPVPQDPTVTIRFTGLLVFCFDKRRKICQIGVHSKTDDHELRLRFVKKGPDPGSESEQRLTLSHGMIRQSSDLWLDVEGDPPPTQQTAAPFIAGRWGEPPTDPQDFRWVVDLEGEHFYNRPLKVKRDVLRPILSVAKGLFYTATLTPDSYRVVPAASERVRGSTAKGRVLGKIAEYVGANIYLTHRNQTLVLRAGQGGPELLRLTREEGATYEVTIENGDTPQAPADGDFQYYHDAVSLNRGEPRIVIEPYGLPAFRDSLTRACGEVTLSKSSGFVFD